MATAFRVELLQWHHIKITSNCTASTVQVLNQVELKNKNSSIHLRLHCLMRKTFSTTLLLFLFVVFIIEFFHSVVLMLQSRQELDASSHNYYADGIHNLQLKRMRIKFELSAHQLYFMYFFSIGQFNLHQRMENNKRGGKF